MMQVFSNAQYCSWWQSVYTWQMRSSWKGGTWLLTGFAKPLLQNKATSLSYQNLAAVRHPEQGIPSERHCWSQCILKTMQNESSCCPTGYCPIAASSLLSPLGVIVQGNTGVAQLSILMKILIVCVFLPPSDLQVLSHRSIVTHLTYGRTTDLCFPAKVTHSVPCPLVQFKYPPLAQMLGHVGHSKKTTEIFHLETGGIPKYRTSFSQFGAVQFQRENPLLTGLLVRKFE